MNPRPVAVLLGSRVVPHDCGLIRSHYCLPNYLNFGEAVVTYAADSSRPSSASATPVVVVAIVDLCAT
jgi:hypothetical protein